jgi:hypothetical protein
MKTPEKIEEDPDDQEPADEGDIQKEYSCWLVVQPKYKSSNKKQKKQNKKYMCKNFGHYRYCPMTWNIFW